VGSLGAVEEVEGLFVGGGCGGCDAFFGGVGVGVCVLCCVSSNLIMSLFEWKDGTYMVP
jgi:hypothetical protein